MNRHSYLSLNGKPTGCARALGLALALTMKLTLSFADERSAQDTQVYVLDTASYKGEVSSIVVPKIDKLLRDRLESQPNLAVLDKFKEEGDKPANAAIRDAMDAYNSGIGLLVAEDHEGAAKSFKKAVDLLEANLADVDSYEVFTDAQLRLGLAYIKAGFEYDARAALKTYANLTPDAKLSKKDYPEELVESVEK